MVRSHLLLAASSAIVGVSHSFVFGVAPVTRWSNGEMSSSSSVLPSSIPSDMDNTIHDSNGDDDDDAVEPGKMRVSEIKSELDMRGIQYKDCFDKESLVERLEEARATGRADPSILNEFNKKKLEENFSGKKLELNDEDLERIKANDGSLPGGMSPETLKRLVGNPEVMALLQSPKMQEAMKLMMTGGREELEEAIAGDPELQQVIEKLNVVMGGV